MQRKNTPGLVTKPQLEARDPLTAALTKVEFQKQIRTATREALASGADLSLLVVDIDHFKSINDAFGHARGDEVLREFADRVRGAVRAADSFFRFGGDEFALLLLDTGKPQALTVAQRLLEQIRAEPFVGSPPLSVSLSIGAASLREDAQTSDDLFEAADQHLLEAKRRGRGQVVGKEYHRSDSPFQALSRLIDRDEEVEAVYAFLSDVQAVKRGTLRVEGAAGGGKSRFLADTARAAQLLGYRVLALKATPALGGRALGMITEAHPEYESLVRDGSGTFAGALAAELDGRSAGLLITIDDIADADSATLELLQDLLLDSQLPVVAVVGASLSSDTAPHPTFDAPLAATISLPPLNFTGVQTWLRTALRWEPPSPFVEWLHRETSGLPAGIERGLARLISLGVLVRKNSSWELDPHYRNFSLGAWLDSASDRTTSNLPAVLGPILGREVEIREAKQRIRAGRLLTLFGPGGFGKTRLAVQVAAEMAREFPDGVCFVPLAPVTSTEAIDLALAESLRVSLRADADPRQQIVDHLRGKQMLLVLDNFEHLISATPMAAELLAAAPGLKILATSREKLDLQNEAVLLLRGMPLPETEAPEEIRRSPAVQLFVQHARRQRQDLSPTEADLILVSRICHRLGGIPLAIEIAAGLIHVLGCDEILTEIERNPDVLVTSRRDAPDRHRSLRAVFDFSWNLLSEEEQRIWSQLSLFRGGFRREAAEAVAGAGLPALSALANKSLVHRDSSGRFEIHGVLLHYASQQLAESPAHRVEGLRQFVSYFTTFLTERVDRNTRSVSREHLEEVSEELENIRLAVHQTLDWGDEATAEHLIRGLFEFFDLSGRYREGQEMLAWACDRISDDRLRGMLLSRKGYLCAKLGQKEKSKQLHLDGLRTLRRAGARKQVSLSLHSLGNLAYQEGNYELAERRYRRALRIFTEVGADFGIALCLNDLGNIAFAQGRYCEAEKCFRDSLTRRSRLGDEAGRAKCLTNLGMIADLSGRPEEARDHFEGSLAAARASADRRGIATALNNLGVLGRRVGEEEESRELLEDARHFLQQALEVYEQIGARGGTALTLYNLGDIACMLGEYEAAEGCHREAIVRATDAGATSLLTTIFIGVSKLLIKTGDAQRAVELLSCVHAHPATIDEDRVLAGQLLEELASHPGIEVFSSSGTAGATRPLLELASELAGGFRSEGNDVSPEAPAPAAPEPPEPEEAPTSAPTQEFLERARFAERQAQHELAREHYQGALAELRETDDEVLAAPLIRWIGLTYLKEGNLDGAEDCFAASLAAATVRNDTAGAAHAINAQGCAAYERRDLLLAVAKYHEARELAKRADSRSIAAIAEHNLGIVARLQSNSQAALQYCRSSLRGFRSLGLDEHIAEVLNTLGLVYTDLRRWSDAEAAFREASERAKQLGNLRTQLTVQVNRAELWIAQDNFAQALSICETSRVLAEELGDAHTLGEIHKLFGIIFRTTKEWARAEEHLATAAEIAEHRGDPLLAGEIASEQAVVAWRQGQNRETLQQLNRADRFFAQLPPQRAAVELERRMEEFQNFFLEVASRWSDSIEAADAYTRGHCERVADYACALAEDTGMDSQSLFWFRIGALLHDVGKIVVPPEILNKPGKLSTEERLVIERHPDAGVEMLADIDFPGQIREMVRFHHERWEGRGYPTGIGGEEIPFAARILCIADVYDALTSDRAYRAGFTHQKAIEIMEDGMRGHFDPDLFARFKQLCDEERIVRGGSQAVPNAA